MSRELKILSIGNSFSVDTMQFVAEIARAMGVRKVHLGNLYVGGCSINRHYTHAMEDAPAYTYYSNSGDGWTGTPQYKISDAVLSDRWDWINIQHGTGDGGRYSDPASYEKLPALMDYVKSLAPDAKYSFNMTWVGEPESTHHEIVAFGGDQIRLYERITQVTSAVVAPMTCFHRVIPTGTAIQNARTAIPERLTRDNYHLSLDLGRYIAGLCFYRAITGEDISRISWMPETVTEEQRDIAVGAVKAALQNPFACTELK